MAQQVPGPSDLIPPRSVHLECVIGRKVVQPDDLLALIAEIAVAVGVLKVGESAAPLLGGVVAGTGLRHH